MHSPDASLASNPTLTDIAAALKLIRASLLMLLFMTTAFSGALWNAIQNIPEALKPIEVVPVVLFSVVCFIVVRTYVSADKIAKVCACSVHNQVPAPAKPEN